jgi:xylulokinase
MPVEIVEAEEGAAYGAALLAGVGSKVWASVDEACETVVRVAERVEPDPVAAALMNRNYNDFRALYPALRTLPRKTDRSMNAR